jgi:hypothetical protein
MTAVNFTIESPQAQKIDARQRPSRPVALTLPRDLEKSPFGEVPIAAAVPMSRRDRVLPKIQRESLMQAARFALFRRLN